MIAIISPAKNIDFSFSELGVKLTTPAYVDKANFLSQYLKSFSPIQLQQFYKVNQSIADLNFTRFQSWRNSPNQEDLGAAGFIFNGEVYRGFDVRSFLPDHLSFANLSILILSGLYGVLNIQDGIQPYRLEMGSKLSVADYSNLYKYWSDDVTDFLNERIESSLGDKCLVNLASVEYAKVVNLNKLKYPLLNIDFKQEEAGSLRSVSVYAKRARGLMARFIALNHICNVEDLKAFDFEGYSYSSHHSQLGKWIFVR